MTRECLGGRSRGIPGAGGQPYDTAIPHESRALSVCDPHMCDSS